jgi:hypothetical protein
MEGQKGVDAVDPFVELVVNPRNLVPDARRVIPDAQRRPVHQALDGLHIRELVGVGHVVPLGPDGRVAALGPAVERGDLATEATSTSTCFHDLHGFVPRYRLDSTSVC